MRISDWSSDVCSSDLKAARGVAWSRDPDSPFGQCPVPSAQTIWLGSSDGKYLDRLTIAIAPYEIGPYVEGSYKINLPMSAAIVHARSEARSVGKACVSTCRSRWSQYH